MGSKRWVVLAAGLVIQTILGGIYAWSIFVPELTTAYGLNQGQCGAIFGLCIAVFTLSMIAGGRLLARRGPRLTAGIGACLFGLGYLVASWSGGDVWLLLLGISVLSGAGIGFGYVCPLTVGMQWFPRHKGLVTGVSVGGFGGGAILLSALAVRALEGGIGVLIVFRWLGVIAWLMLLLAALLLSVPPRQASAPPSSSLWGDLRSWPFLLCLYGIFAGTFAGLLVIGNLRPIVEEAGLTVHLAATAVSFFAVGNAVGRVLWGFIFDRAGFVAMPLSLAGFAAVLLLVNMSSASWLLMSCSVLLGFSFGANFVIYAAALSQHFGMGAFPRLYPICFLGYGLAGIIGPGVGGMIADRTGSFDGALYLSIALLSISALMTGIGLRVFARRGQGHETSPAAEQQATS